MKSRISLRSCGRRAREVLGEMVAIDGTTERIEEKFHPIVAE
jgi:hypothetical protein